MIVPFYLERFAPGAANDHAVAADPAAVSPADVLQPGR